MANSPEPDLTENTAAEASTAASADPAPSPGAVGGTPSDDAGPSILDAIRDSGVEFSDDADALDLDNPDPGDAEGQTPSDTTSEDPEDGASPDPADAKSDKDADDAEKAEAAGDKAKTEETDEAGFTAAERDQLSKTAKDRIHKLVSRAKEAEAGAGKFQQISNFMAQNGITEQDANTTFGIMAALRRGDDQLFLKLTMPFVEQARARLGQHVPDDLRTQIEDGYITEEHARELAKHRAQAQAATAQAEEARTRANTIAQNQHATAVQTAVSSWIAATSKTDPDFARKEPMVTTLVKERVARDGPPPDPQTAVQWAQDAYQQVAGMIRELTPRAAPTRPTPSSDPTRTAPNRGSEPSSLREAALAGLRRAQS